MYPYIPTPAVLIDLGQVDINIRAMVEANLRAGINHRPHIKAHKSVYLAQRQLALGAVGVTCAKLAEAEAMADGGVKDILIAFPLIGADKLARYRALIERGVALRTVVNSLEGATGLSELGLAMGTELEVLMELDGGIGRGGLPAHEPALRFAQSLSPLKGVKLVGLLYYGGDIYGCRDEAEVKLRAQQETAEILGTAQLLKNRGFEMRILSGGSSFSSKYPDCITGITEVRAGNYIFNDVAQLSMGLVTQEQCALRMLCTVVALAGENRAIIDAGSKVLSNDLVRGREGYGYVCGREDITVLKLYEEHGILQSEGPIALSIGERVQIIPNHSCVQTNLTGRAYGMRGGRLERVLPIEGQHCSY